jgi:hypothetical protein
VAIEFSLQQQVHSYRNGHSLVGSSIKLKRGDQDLVDRLSDLAGPIGPGQTFSPYLTFYPLALDPYYVVARTWQDLSAPRAGCVVTRSLFVPMDCWRNGAGLLSLLLALEHEGRDISQFAELSFVPVLDEQLDILEKSGTIEFVEAFFLEQRQPIVIFDSPAPETFAIRLIEGLWPAFRSSLAICTHAYSPRSIHGRPFDLLCAPASARSNFSAWTGRRIDGQAINRQPRHHWTESISDRLFGSASVVPLTVSFGELNVPQDAADESKFRLAMLWEELCQRSNESPFAILGLLDIVSSLGQSERSVSRFIGHAIRSSIGLATRLDTRGLLQYLVTLLGKFSTRLPPISALSAIRRAASNATVQDPHVALTFLRERTEQGSATPAVVLAGIAEGFVSGLSISELLDALLSLDDALLLSFVAYGHKFASVLIAELQRSGSHAGLEKLERVVVIADAKLRARARRNIVPFLRDGAESGLLAKLLIGVDGRALFTSVRWLSASGALEVPELKNALVSAADSPAKMRTLRTLLMQLPQSQGVDTALIQTMAVTQENLEWLIEKPIDHLRKGFLLKGVLAAARDIELQKITPALGDSILEATHLDTGDTSTEVLTRLLRLMPSSCDVVLQIALARANDIAHSGDRNFIQFLLARALSEPVLSSLSVSVLNEFALKIPGNELARMMASSTIEPEQVSRNLVLFISVTERVRGHLASHVGVLTDQIVRRRGPVPNLEAIDVWAGLIVEAAQKSNEAESLQAASTALDFALRSTRVQVSGLLKVVFPTVYEQLRGTESTPSMFDFFSFHDWDKCKTARNDLVRAFINSVWPPVDLLMIAYEIKEVQSFSRILAAAQEGRKVLARALADPALPQYVRNAFLNV